MSEYKNIIGTDICFICEKDQILEDRSSQDALNVNLAYLCPLCGNIKIFHTDRIGFDAFLREYHKFNPHEKEIICREIRERFENRGRKELSQGLALEDFRNYIKNYRERSPLDKIDEALIKLGDKSRILGDELIVSDNDFPYYHCVNPDELERLLKFLHEDKYIHMPSGGSIITNCDFIITQAGYRRLNELKESGKDSKQCFVAMWFDDKVKDAYIEAIQPAIEYEEPGKPYKALKINNVEHNKDINVQILLEIRRSKFMVCDLTGYRGGVYFEAGYAYGLGKEVIYTCREDWIKEDKLKNKKGKGARSVNKLYDSNNNEIKVKKEGVHFDLEHINRISWHEDNLEEFREKLERRIRMTIQ